VILQKHGRKLGKEMEKGAERGMGELSGARAGELGKLRGSGRGPGQRGEAAGWMGRYFCLCSVCLSEYYKFRSCLDLKTVWRPEATAAANRREGKEGKMDPPW